MCCPRWRLLISIFVISQLSALSGMAAEPPVQSNKNAPPLHAVGAFVVANNPEDACKDFDAQSIINRAPTDKGFRLIQLSDEHPLLWTFSDEKISLWLCSGNARLAIVANGTISDWKFMVRPKTGNDLGLEIYKLGDHPSGAVERKMPPVSNFYAGDPASGTDAMGFRKGGPYILRGRDILGCRDGNAVEALSAADAEERFGKRNYPQMIAAAGCIDLPNGLEVYLKGAGPTIAMVFPIAPSTRLFFVLRSVVQDQSGNIVPVFHPDPYKTIITKAPTGSAGALPNGY